MALRIMLSVSPLSQSLPDIIEGSPFISGRNTLKMPDPYEKGTHAGRLTLKDARLANGSVPLSFSLKGSRLLRFPAEKRCEALILPPASGRAAAESPRASAFPAGQLIRVQLLRPV